MLARATDWLAQNHPELQPREHQPVFGTLRDREGSTTLSNTITLDASKLHSDAAYVDAFTHELLHVQDFWWKELEIALLGQGPQQLDPPGFHQAIYDQGTAILIEYDNAMGGR
jgi:hypothetical protein